MQNMLTAKYAKDFDSIQKFEEGNTYTNCMWFKILSKISLIYGQFHSGNFSRKLSNLLLKY
jgi:hypothetical protein